MLNNQQIAKLSGETGIDARTIARWYAGFSIWTENAKLLERAAQKLKLPLPKNKQGA